MIQLASKTAFRIAGAIAVIASLLLIWISLGVGIIGADGDPANRYYFAVIVVGLVGAGLSRLSSRGMALTLFAMALVQALIGIYAVAMGLGMPYSPPIEILGLTGFFVFSFTAAGWLFQRSAGGDEAS